MSRDFPDGAAMIFGGSGGIGQGVALEFARAGTPVAVCYRSKKAVVEKTAELIRNSTSVRASIHQLDITR